jgi:L-lactate dehydrogenase complex protein LldF
MSPPERPFSVRVENALADKKLRAATGRVTKRFAAARADGLATLDDPDSVRDRARRIRAHTLRKLDVYLAQFAENVEAAGGHVFWARDASEANAYVADLARARGVQQVVKSKSMVSEEVGLNEALLETGLQVVETDLGEYIIQLASETPSHIIVPAAHKSATQIGALFHQKLGMPPTKDIAAMTNTARTTLRDAFLSADMGISGVNFGIAETGTICLITNEGNGRLVTSVPRIHVALMGIERLVPTLQDLAVMLQVLARSATGQKLTVYTSLLTGPRRPGEPDGPEELHIVLIDNGRTRMLAGDLAEILYCIRCGACLNGCPVYREIGGHAYGGVYSGPVGAVVMPGLGGIGPWVELPHASSLCGECREVCPVRIDIPLMLLKLRDEGVRAGHRSAWLAFGFKLYTWAARRPAMFRLSGRIASLLTRLAGRDEWLRRLPSPLSPWTDSRDFPQFASESFLTEWMAERR